MIAADFLDDMRVHLLFNRLGRDAERIFHCQRRARSVGDDANAVDTEKRTAAVLLVIRFISDAAK